MTKTLLPTAIVLFLSAAFAATLAAAESAVPPAKAVIQIWMWGGPSQLDTFDPKPGAGAAYTGPYSEDRPTNIEGIRIIKGLPLLAGMADKYAIIRSMTHGINAHETASYLMQTGHGPASGQAFPSLGAIISYFKGRTAGYSSILPPYIVLTESQGRFPEEGFLGPRYKPFATGGNPAGTPFEVEGIVSPGLDDRRQLERRELLHALDTLGAAMPGERAFADHAAAEEAAYGMILGEAREAFDLARESDAVRDRYGRTSFGQSCLAARRLVERGVPYVTINYKGWDTHKGHFGILDQRHGEMDKGMSALLGDLSERGLLESTIVWWGGEFGRTPKIDWEAPWNGGRGHYGAAFSVLLAGGGLKGGTVVGATDAIGGTVVSRPVKPEDLIGTLLMRLGIDPAGFYPPSIGQNVSILPPLKDEPGVGILRELLPK